MVYIKPIIYKGVDTEYIVGFASVKDGDLYLYGLGNYGIVVVNDVSIIADSFANDVFYVYNENYLIVKNNEDLYGVVNFDGDVIIDYQYKDNLHYHKLLFSRNHKSIHLNYYLFSNLSYMFYH